MTILWVIDHTNLSQESAVTFSSKCRAWLHTPWRLVLKAVWRRVMGVANMPCNAPWAKTEISITSSQYHAKSKHFQLLN